MAERTLLRVGPAAWSRRRHRGRGLVLAYHNIVPDGEPVVGDPSLHLPRRQFARQLDLLLEEDVDVVSLDALLDPARSPGRLDSHRRVAITFDDAYRGAVQLGVDELVRRGLGGTIFVVPGLVGDRTFWWDALSATSSEMDDSVRSGALTATSGRTDEVLAWARREGLGVGEVPEYARSADEAELRTAVMHETISLGSHTWSHPNLTQLTSEMCRGEFTRAADWLRERFGPPRWLSYPYGLSGQASQEAVMATDHRGAFRIEGGWLPRPSADVNVFELPRVNVPSGVSIEGFALRLAGLLCGDTFRRPTVSTSRAQ